MNQPTPRLFFFDYVDPLSYLVELELREAEEQLGEPVERVPFELRPPPAPMLDPDAPEWRERWAEAGRWAAECGVTLTPLPIVPWTRKAHELVLHASEHDLGSRAHEILFEHITHEGADLGRIDVLVRLAVGLGLDETETKAVLDVDRHAASIVRARERGTAMGVVAPPALASGGDTVEGFRNAAEIVKFFRSF